MLYLSDVIHNYYVDMLERNRLRNTNCLALMKVCIMFMDRLRELLRTPLSFKSYLLKHINKIKFESIDVRSEKLENTKLGIVNNIEEF